MGASYSVKHVKRSRRAAMRTRGSSRGSKDESRSNTSTPIRYSLSRAAFAMEGAFHGVAQETTKGLGIAEGGAGENLVQFLPYLRLGEDILAPLRDRWSGRTLGERWFHPMLRD